MSYLGLRVEAIAIMGAQARRDMSEQAERLREAFESRQLDRLIELMDAEVIWRGISIPGQDVPHCHDRDEVREVMAEALAQGIDGRPIVVAEAGDSVVVDPQIQPPGSNDLHQVATFRGDRIVLLQDFPDRISALAAIGA
jgi:ketosteroid isomerase-like protein